MSTQNLTALISHAILVASQRGQYTEIKMADQTSEQLPTSELLRMTADVVAAYVRNNPLAANDLPGVISTVYASLTDVSGGAAVPPPEPAVPIRRSVTPDEYRAKWQLGPDYPMVAPNYAKRRSEFAKQIGLGQKKTRRKRGAKRGAKRA